VSMGILTEDQRYTATEYQRLAGNPMTFGEVVVHHGYCTPQQVDEAIRLQTKLRSKKTSERAEATFTVAQKSKEAIGAARKQLIATGRAIIEKAGNSDIPTPVLGVPIIGG